MFLPHTLLIDSTLVGHKRSRAQLTTTTSSSATVEVPTFKKRRIVKSKKSVSFATADTTTTATTASTGTWFTASDYAGFKENIKRDVLHLATLHKQRQLARMDRSEFCPTGLEKYTASYNEQTTMKTLKQQRLMAVLGQQILQKQMGVKVYNQEPIQHMACALSQPAVAKAIQRASRLVLSC